MSYALKKLILSPSARLSVLPRLTVGGWAYTCDKKIKSVANSSSYSHYSKSYVKQFASVAGALLATYGIYHFIDAKKRALTAATYTPHHHIGKYKADLPYYSLKQVSEHSGKKEGIWVTYGEGVYDISSFVDEHPGGDRILMAAGGALEPFWILYGVHKEPKTLAILEKYRIGNLTPEEVSKNNSNMDMEDPYRLEPRRHPALKASSVKPFNAEPPPSLLVDSFITPVDLFYVRNHLPVPEIDVESYKLEIYGVGIRPHTLTLEQLKKNFTKYTVTVAIQCAGNRRSEMSKVKPVKGLDWGHATIGNASFSGARLRDVLKACGLKKRTQGLEHVHFEGLDEYGASIPIEKAMNAHGDVLLAYEMNGEPLTRDHGFPVRAVVPGVVGARNVKWLGDIVLAGTESTSHWQQNDYKGFSPSVDWDSVDFTKSPAIQVLPVTSAICQPEAGAKVQVVNGHVKVKGYAWSGGGQKIVRVDVTADKGKTWHVAKFSDQESYQAPRHWAWTLWEVDVPVPSGRNQVELWCKAVDSSYNTQPECFENIWNLRGVLSNAYHRVKITLLP